MSTLTAEAGGDSRRRLRRRSGGRFVLTTLFALTGAAQGLCAAQAPGPSTDAPCRLESAAARWRPRPVPDGSSENTLHVSASAAKGGVFRFVLYEVTRFPGRAMNGPGGGQPDLEFASEQEGYLSPIGRGSEIALQSGQASRRAVAALQASDGAAWGLLRAELLIDGAWRSCTADTGESFITIPRDRNGNRIADSWEEEHDAVGLPANSDSDSQPEGAAAGDGFSLFEEYRGFFTRMGWVGTDPRHKDVFINDEGGRGTGYFEASGLAVHLVNAEQYGGNDRRSMTLNRVPEYAAGPEDQLALWLAPRSHQEREQEKHRQWYSRRLPGHSGPPNTMGRIVVDFDLIAAHEAAMSWIPPANAGVPQAAVIDMDWVIAHQLGHAVGMTHPGPGLQTAKCGTAPCLSAPWAGVTSGPEDSIMRFHFASHYKGRDGAWYTYPAYDMPGARYCTNRIASGINAGAPRKDDEGRPLPLAGSAAWPSSCLSGMHLSGQQPTAPREGAPLKLGDLRRLYEEGELHGR